jgi:PTH1 family peptidyl-tRNA hydrolase
MIELVAFLGNPGGEYEHNRHNAAWLLARELPFYGALDWRNKYRGRYAALEGTALPAFRRELPGGTAEAAGQGAAAPGGAAPPARVHFLMPETYMNNSGDAVLAAASFFKIPPERILLVHDELELPLGTLSLKFSGGLGGHNGLRSMRDRFNTAAFWRLRIGIGRPDDRRPGEGGPQGSGRGIVGWVLSDFSAGEETLLAPVFSAAAALLTEALLRDPEDLLPQWGKRKVAGGLQSAVP